MGLLDKKPQDATAQFLEFAESGRLVAVDGPGNLGSLVAMVAGASSMVGLGTAMIVLGLTGHAAVAVPLLGAALLLGGAAVLAPAIRLLRDTAGRGPLPIRPGAVLAPDLVRKGNWIFRSGAWVRVEHVGRDGGGRVQALLGTGDVVELRTPVTVAGDHFRPVRDPVESLRR